MSLKKILAKLVGEPSKTWTYVRLPDAHVPEPTGQPIRAGESYMTARMKSVRVPNSRRWTKKCFGSCGSSFRVPGIDGRVIEHASFVSPEGMREVDPAHLDRCILVDKVLLGSVPYVGGAVGMDLSVQTVLATDLAAPYLSLLESLSSLGGPTPTALAGNAELLTKGLDMLFGVTDKTSLEIGLSTDLEPPRSGWYAITRIEAGQIDGGTLRVLDDTFELATADGKAIEGAPYLVFTLSGSDENEVWFLDPQLAEAYGRVREAVREGDFDRANERLAEFRRIVLTSDVLLPGHADKVADETREWVYKVLSTSKTGSGDAPEIPDLRQML